VIVEQPARLPIYAPIINSFTANPSSLQPYQEVVLTWTVSNADTVILSPGIGSVSNSGLYRVTPGYTTTYTLSAINSAGSVNASTTVTVVPLISTYGSSISTEIASGGSIAQTGTSSLVTAGFGGDNGWGNSGLLLVLLIGLLAAATASIVILARKPALAYAGRRAGTQAGYLPWATSARDATEIPKTTPVGAGGAAKFIADGGQISVPGSGSALGRDDFRSLLAPAKANLLSREHLRIDYANGEYYIEDRNSTNGTKVNGSRIISKDRLLLNDGDVIILADVLTLTFKT
jgi:hypothetical protein